MGYRKAPAPAPPVGLTAALPNDWVHNWRLVRVQPQVEVSAWDGLGKVKVTPSVKHVGLWAATYATYETGADIRPGVDILANVTGYSTKAVGIALDVICRLGFMWQYVDGSQGGRPRPGRPALKSEYRLTSPDDIFSGRVPLFGAPDDDPNSDHLMSDQAISDPGSPELSSRNTRTQFAPPLQDPHIDPDMTMVSLSATSVEVPPDRPKSDQVISVRVIQSPLTAVVPATESSPCEYPGCQAAGSVVDRYHARCRYLADVKARGARHPEAS